MRTLNKEEMFVVYLALMICRQLGFPKPPKRQVLNVVESWELLKFSPDDHAIVSSGEPKWRNDLAWARKDLVQRAWGRNAEIDEWELSELGIEKITSIAKKWANDSVQEPARIERVMANSQRLTAETLRLMQSLGRGEKLTRRPKT